ncbi:MAG: Ca-activated chloride channel family protein [Planctomycetota bacterium]|jgi:Ca-activated chloride channel family protein
MMGFEILRPEGLPLLALGLLPLILGLWALGQRLRGLRALAEPRHLARLFPDLRISGGDLIGWLRRRVILRAVLGGLSLSLLALAFIGPVKGFSLVPVQSQEVDIVVVLDTSRSMLVEDVSPNRLDRAKAEIGALLDVMEGERLALVGFAGAARPVTPLTRDLDTARYFLQRMSPSDNRKGGTDIGAALGLALERFEEGSGSNQAIILVTDGEDLSGEGLSAAERAAERGIAVHVLGMGTESGGKIPDGNGGFVVDPDSGSDRSDVISKLGPVSLKAIADVSGGIYLQAKGRVLPLEELYKRGIATLEGRDIVDGKERVPQDRFQWPLGVALVLLLFEASLRDSRRTRRNKPVLPTAGGVPASSDQEVAA